MQQKKEARFRSGNFPIILKRERKLRGWSQADVAARIGSDPKTVGRWERGLTSPSPYLCQHLSELYEKTVQELGLIEVENKESSLGDKRGTENSAADETAIERPAASVATIQAKSGPTPASASSSWQNALRFRAGRKVKTRRAVFLYSLAAGCLLLSTTVVWWSLHRGSALDNPYTGQGVLALNDPLTQNSAAGWSLSNNDEGQCFFAAGAYRIKGIKNEYMKLCLAAETYFNDFTYEVQMQVVAGDCGGLAFRTTFPQLYYFLICQDGKYRFVRYDRDNQANIRIISSGTSTAIDRGLKRTNVIAVVAVGETFALYINHTRVYSGTDGAYLDGQIGLLVHTCSIIYVGPPPDICAAPVEAMFRNARVWKI